MHTLESKKTVGANVGAKVKNDRSQPITVLGLKALGSVDDGRTITFGESMTGKVRVGRNGEVSVHATWRYRFGGKIREIRIGTWRAKDGMSLKALRDERDRLATEVRSGVDPIERRAAQRLTALADQAEAIQQERRRAEIANAANLERQRRLTVRELFERWTSTQLQPRIRADGKRIGRKDGGQYVREQFERHVFSRIGDLAVAEVRKAELLALLDVQTAAGKMRTANVLLGDLKQMLDFAFERDLIVANPLAATKKAKIGGASVERERVLSEGEIGDLARAVPTARLHPRSAAAIWLTLATGVRVGELMGSVWSDALPPDPKAAQQLLDALTARADAENVKIGVIDLAARTWYLPDTKNQRDHMIHLSEFAVAQLVDLRALRESSAWLFPATDRTRPVCVKSFGKQLADRQRMPERRMKGRSKATEALLLPGGRWTAHDLRRTAATLMAGLGISGDVIDECLNHMIESRVRRTYIRDRRPTEQARAFDALGAKLGALISGETFASNIISMRTA